MSTRPTPLAQVAVAPETLAFDMLDGWRDDALAEALSAFVDGCAVSALPVWQGLGKIAETWKTAPRAFFEAQFTPTLFRNGGPGLVTGYFEPEIAASPVRTDRFCVPLLRPPADLPSDAEGPSRAEIVRDGCLEGRGLEIAWVEDQVELFFLQVQGSGRLRLPDGGLLRIGYAAGNGHGYRSIGRELVARGVFTAETITAERLKDWIRQGEPRRLELLLKNPSYVFFRVVDGLEPGSGPLGSLGCPVTAGRSIAVDPEFVPLGAPVWLETEGAQPLRRLTVAQDTGSAIRGAQRADLFFGTGPEAGRQAGELRDHGRLIVLMPKAGCDPRFHDPGQGG